jgi:hypothetical protein
MSAEAPTPAWLTSEWLTDVLRRNGTLSRGSVDSFTIEAPRTTINVMRLRLTYSPAQDAGPRSLFLSATPWPPYPIVDDEAKTGCV